MKIRFRRLLHRIIEPQILFPGSAVVTLLLIWGATLFYVHTLNKDLESHSLVSTQQILETYEAQVSRSLGAIDQAINLVTWWRAQGADRRISDLGYRELLPPDLVFGISIADASGRIIDSNRATGVQDIGTRAYFDLLRAGEPVVVGQSVAAPLQTPVLHFARRLEAPDGQFDGAAIVEVEAGYFVSGYEESVLGQHGLLALLGDDGVLRVERSGDTVDSGRRISSQTLLESDGSARRLEVLPAADGGARWMARRELYAFPLSVLVGLSVRERFTALADRVRGYFLLAAMASLVCVTSLGLIGKQSWQLARSREREVQIRKAHAERVEYLAYHDGLTGLANRSLFSRLLSRSLAEAMRYERVLAVLYLDLDRFKPINDLLGHDAGDQLLKEIARRLQGCVRTSDTVARLGGDEFVVLVPQFAGEAEVAAIAAKILAAVGEPMMLLGREVYVTASVGIALSPRDGRDEETLKKNADAAMYQAKGRGKNNFQFHTDRLGTTSMERLNMESNLRHALERGELRVHYQARRDLASGRINAMEALPHWVHPENGVLPPARFLKLAEESGMTVPIGRWLLRTACEQGAAMRRHGLPELCVAVNLTASQFYDDRLLDDVRSTLAGSGLAPWLLELAVPELALSHLPDQTRTRLQGLRDIGVRLAVGDFGAGYAWLNALQDLSFDTIKIDPNLTSGIARSTQGAALANAVISVGRRLSTAVVAQGLEAADEAELLRQHAGEGLQGCEAAEPLPAEQFLHGLRQQVAAAGAPTLPPGRTRAG